MTTADLLSALRARGVTLAVDGDRLKVTAPRGALTPELQAELAARKPQILELLAHAATVRDQAAPAITRVDRSGRLEVSFGQQRLWFLQQMDPASSAYTIASAITFPADADAALLERALTILVARHESLRTSFDIIDGEPVQVVHLPGPVSLGVRDLRSLAAEAQEEALGVMWSAEGRHAFDLSEGPPIRFGLAKLSSRTCLLVTQHHIITDRWSLGLFMRELAGICDSLRTHRPLPPEPEVQYVDFAHWQRRAMETPAYRAHLAYWTRQLAGPLPVLELPLDRPRPPVQTFVGSWEKQHLNRRVCDDLFAFAQQEGVTPFMVLLTAFAVLLSRYGGQQDILVGTPIAGRTERQLESVIGCFVNVLVMRLRLDGRPTFRQLLAQARDVALDAFAHQDIPFEHLVAELHPQRDVSRSPIFQVAFNYQNAPKGAAVSTDMDITTSGASMFDLTLNLNDSVDGLFATFEYNVALFDRETILQLLYHYQVLLHVASRYPDMPIDAAPLLSDKERTEMLGLWNFTAQPYARDARVHDLIAGQAARTPDRVAVTADGGSYTYAELIAAAGRVAHGLRAHGVGRGDRVGVCVERSERMVAALIGVLMADAAYVPLDPAFPRDRLAYMIEDAGVHVVITDRPSADALPDSVATRLFADVDAPLWSVAAPDAARSVSDSAEAAYVIYTSGSTGRPKGVEVPHRAMVNFLTTMARQPGLAADDVLAAVTTLSFDIAGLELFLPLTVGARVVVASRADVTEGGRLLDLLHRSHATVLQATPATWRLLIEGGWTGNPPLKMLCGGEALPRDLANALVERGGSLWNIYGPTETTVWSSAERVVAGTGPVSIGRPIGNTQLYVLDTSGQLVPPGVPGELYIGGDGVALGYVKRPDLTAERFLPDPFADRPGARMYRTGDVAKYRRDGRIDCLGRLDHQVKLRGFRLELGEIEAALVDHPAVREAAVVLQRDPAGEARLVAFAVPASEALPTASDLRRQLRTRLPDYMVPAIFIELRALPLTQNGKVDRGALPAAFAQSGGRQRGVPPRTETERALAGVWMAVLGIDHVSVTDNFFDVGGHSLASMKVIARVQQAVGVALNPRDLLLDSLEQIAATCDRRMQRPAAAAPAARVTAGAN